MELRVNISSVLEEKLRELLENLNSSHGRDLNPGPLPYQGNALPAELPWPIGIYDVVVKTFSINIQARLHKCY